MLFGEEEKTAYTSDFIVDFKTVLLLIIAAVIAIFAFLYYEIWRMQAFVKYGKQIESCYGAVGTEREF